jgi:hypothetical protein
MAWNFNMDEAPKGYKRSVSRAVGKNMVVFEEHVSVPIIAAGNDGIVTLSKWLPHEQRWNMFSKGTPPLAWMPWPSHPKSGAA